MDPPPPQRVPMSYVPLAHSSRVPSDLAATLAIRLCDNAFFTLFPNPKLASSSLGINISLIPNHDMMVRKMQTADSRSKFSVGGSISRNA